MNGQRWAEASNLFTVYASTVEEYSVAAAAHPLHVHVSPMQVRQPWAAESF